MPILHLSLYCGPMLTSYQMIFGQFRGKIADEFKMPFIIKIVLSDLYKALF